MKKLFVLLFSFVLLFLWGCESGKLMNVTMFSDKFNKYCENYQIDSKKITSQNINGSIQYSYILSRENDSGQYLISLYAAPENQNVRSCSITVALKPTAKKSKNINIDKNSYEELMQIYSAAIQAYTKGSQEHAAELLKNLGLDTTKKALTKGSKYKNEQWYRYALIANDAGVTFIIESVTLCPTTETDLTLRS